jgi:hypothetical protein
MTNSTLNEQWALDLAVRIDKLRRLQDVADAKYANRPA